MPSEIYKSTGRGKKDLGWLKSHFIFSFSDYYNPIKSSFGTLVAFNDDYVEAGKGFGIHPHANMEIISILLKGKMNHIDTLGYNTSVEAYGVQIMSAGSGLRHEEYNIGSEEVNFLQIWIQPKLQNIGPRYQQRTFPKDKRMNAIKTIVSSDEGLEHCWINQNAKLSLGIFEIGKELEYRFNSINKCLFIFVIEGKIEIDGNILPKRDAIGMWGIDAVKIKALETSEFLIIETPVNQK